MEFIEENNNNKLERFREKAMKNFLELPTLGRNEITYYTKEILYSPHW